VQIIVKSSAAYYRFHCSGWCLCILAWNTSGLIYKGTITKSGSPFQPPEDSLL